MEKNSSTEEKIIQAARKVFTKKGYAATRTRDISEESGFNLALINYYFRSKEKLFEIVMMENIKTFVYNKIEDIINDKETTIPEKLEALVGSYIDMLIANPDLPLFIMYEIRTNPKNIILMRGGFKQRLDNSYFMKQIKEAYQNIDLKINPIHLFMNAMGMIVFPFIASPILQSINNINKTEFNKLMLERKQLIPMWIGNLVQTSIGMQIKKEKKTK